MKINTKTSREMSKEKPVQLHTISADIDQNARGQKTRLSLQPIQNQPQNIPLRLTQSQNYGRKKKIALPKNPQSSIPSIPEDESVVLHESAFNRNSYDAPKRSSQNSRKSDCGGSRRSSKSSYDNAAFVDETTIKITTNNHNQPSNGNFYRKYSVGTSVRSSCHEPSVNSLGVIREQYCCCSKWSRCERMLMIAVGILAVIIVILVVAVGILAQDKESVRPNFHWSF